MDSIFTGKEFENLTTAVLGNARPWHDANQNAAHASGTDRSLGKHSLQKQAEQVNPESTCCSSVNPDFKEMFIRIFPGDLSRSRAL